MQATHQEPALNGPGLNALTGTGLGPSWSGHLQSLTCHHPVSHRMPS
jgi:hypothetical protein